MQYRQPWAASLARLTQRALVECLLLAITGGLAGLLVAWGGVRLILHLALPEAPANINTGPSWSVLGFAFAASLLTGLLFGVAAVLAGCARQPD